MSNAVKTPAGSTAADLRPGDMLRLGASENYVLLCAVAREGGQVRVTAHGYGSACNSRAIPAGNRVRTGLRNVAVPAHETTTGA